DDDAIGIQSFHAHAKGLLPGFKGAALETALKNEHCDGSHWLILYEGVRQGYLPSLKKVVEANSLMKAFLDCGVEFYRDRLPDYSLLLHPGGAPEWVVTAWV